MSPTAAENLGTEGSARLAELADEFWTWRTTAQPDAYDDITRVDRPDGWVADWSGEAIAARRAAARLFARRYRALELSGEPVSAQVNGRLLGSAIARAHWELELLRGWQRNPCFYLDQALLPIYNLLLEPPPFLARRAAAIMGHLHRVPLVLSQARESLGRDTSRAFSRYALHLLASADARLRLSMSALVPLFPDAYGQALRDSIEPAAGALVAYREWLQSRLPYSEGTVAVGRQAFAYFLHRVALLPYSASQLRVMGRQELDRATALEAIMANRYRHSVPRLLPDVDAQVTRQRADETAIRRFLAERRILGQPDDLRHYTFAAMPAYLEPLTWLGVPHELGSPARLHQAAVRYLPAPRPDLPYFPLADARDPRCGIIHEGVHAQQAALSWMNSDPARRRYYDSAANEGIAFYNEELMLLSGLFDEEPDGARFVPSAMRLRAIRVEIDVALALGDTTLDQAASTLADSGSLDQGTAWEEAVFFAANPGQGLSYQIGKLQILRLLADCARLRADAFELQSFHDRLWREGNVPLALQRWELLGQRDELDTADQLAVDDMAHAMDRTGR